MSVPTQPTESSIVTNAYILFRDRSPSTAEANIAISDALAMVKSDLMDAGREWSFLRSSAYLPTTINKNHIQAPTDYSKLMSATILDGTRRGTAQTGATASITLASADSGTDNDTEAKLIVITDGTGVGQARQIIDYDSSTKVATVSEDWDTTPDSTSIYLIVDEQTPLSPKQIWNYEEIEDTYLKDEPTKIYHFADDAEGDFYFDYTPDKVYVVKLNYYSDLRKMDTSTTTNPRYARILRLLEQVFVQGTFVWLLQDDTRYQIEVQRYSQLIVRAAGQFLYPNNANQSAEIAGDAY